MKLRFYNGDIEKIGYDFYCDIAINIVNKRKELMMTQEELAKSSKIKVNRLRMIEGVKYRIKLDEIENIAKALNVTVNNLINAELDSQVGECLYTIYPEDIKDFKLYSEATSKRLAFLKLEKILQDKGLSLFSKPRTRVFVELVGVPITDQELQDKLPKFEENQRVEEV